MTRAGSSPRARSSVTARNHGCSSAGRGAVPRKCRRYRPAEPLRKASVDGGLGRDPSARAHGFGCRVRRAREFLPDDYDEVRYIFSRTGAYRRYKDLLVRRGALERWFDFSSKSEETALQEWCAENGIELSDT